MKTFRSPLVLGLAAFLALTSLASATPPAASHTKPDEVAGAILYRDKGCGRCHGTDLNGTKKGPPLATIQNDKDWAPDRISKQILNGGQKMPPFADALSDPEVAQIVAYLRAKHRPVAPPSAPEN